MPVLRQDHVVDGHSGQSSAINQGLNLDWLIFTIGVYPVSTGSVLDRFDASNGCIECCFASSFLKIALEVCHVSVAIDNAGRLTLKNACFGSHIGLSLLDLFPLQKPCRNVDRLCKVVNLLQFVHLLFILGHYPFPCVAMRNTLLRAELIHHVLAFEA